MKRALIIARPGMEHQTGWGGAFGKGLERRGWKVAFGEPRAAHADYDLFVIWGVRGVPVLKGRLGIDPGERICVLERGYVGDRFSWTSVSFGGGLNGRGIFRGPFGDPSRWDENFSEFMQPWQPKKDGYALILQQVPGDSSIRGVDIESFYARASQAFSSDMPIKIRPHPNISPKKSAEYAAAAKRSFAEDLAGARLAVTWNSNAAVDAVLAGVPTIAMDKGSMAWDVTGHDLVKPPSPDREAWSRALAWKQWRREEMESGFCAEMVGL